jgi:hypothetical protein
VVLSADRRGKLTEDLAQALHSRGLGIPAIALLEAHKPLSFVASQALLALSPLIAVVEGRFPIEDYASLLEDSSNVDRVISRLEELEDREAGH